MEQQLQEAYGRLMISNLLTHLWFGNWEEYSKIMSEIPIELYDSFPFHKYYEKEEVSLLHENHFFIPGDNFVTPYMSTYYTEIYEEEKAKQSLLCLVSMYEKLGFYYPLEKEEFPDHFGSLTAFLAAGIKAEIDAINEGDQELIDSMRELQNELLTIYIVPTFTVFMQKAEARIEHPFFIAFLKNYMPLIKETLVRT